MRELVFLQVCPDDFYYIWQVHLWLESLREIGKSNKAISLIFTPLGREINEKWKELEALYPESKFHYYKDEHQISRLLGIYIPLLRPYTLMRYFEEFPDMENKAIFYCDCDILFTPQFNVDAYLEDDVCYVSDTLSYINASYFDSKIKDALPDKIEQYKKRDILDETCKLVGISREIAEKNNLHSGGAQYLLKGIDHKFWDKVIADCLKIRRHLTSVNREFFLNESKGFQSWCADMWAVLWNLWLLNKEVKIIPEMNFAWSTDNIDKLEKMTILHNAGIGSEKHGDVPVFYKAKFHKGGNPFIDPNFVILSENNPLTLCNHHYVRKMTSLKEKYSINYLNK